MYKQLSQIQANYNLAATAYNQDRKKLSLGVAWDMWLEKLPPAGTILDLGCGDGLSVAKPLDQMGYSVIGLDYSQTQIKLAQKKLSSRKILP